MKLEVRVGARFVNGRIVSTDIFLAGTGFP